MSSLFRMLSPGKSWKVVFTAQLCINQFIWGERTVNCWNVHGRGVFLVTFRLSRCHHIMCKLMDTYSIGAFVACWKRDLYRFHEQALSHEPCLDSRESEKKRPLLPS